jgi:hypothetical protein
LKVVLTVPPATSPKLAAAAHRGQPLAPGTQAPSLAESGILNNP